MIKSYVKKLTSQCYFQQSTASSILSEEMIIQCGIIYL